VARVRYGAIDGELMEELQRIAEPVSARREALRAQGVKFLISARRRPGLTGVRYDLDLHVLPRSGFDNFGWTGYRRRWFGTPQAVEDVEHEVNGVLDRYAAGDEPPSLEPE
jgi:diadenosine tetraphosphate (Ap4A) HIT family hydrolase